MRIFIKLNVEKKWGVLFFYQSCVIIKLIWKVYIFQNRQDEFYEIYYFFLKVMCLSSIRNSQIF